MIRDPLPIGPTAVGLAFVPDGSRLFVAGNFGLVSYALPANTIDHVVQRELYGAYYAAVAVSPDGKQFATAESQGSDNVVTLWSASSYQRGLELVRSSNTFPTRVTYSPDGALLGVAGNLGIGNVYRTSNGTEASWLSTAGDVGSIGFSPDGTLAAVAGFYVSVTRTSDWTEVLHVDQAHTVYTPDLSFSPDGKSVATAGDQRVTVWSTTPGIPRRDLRAPERPLRDDGGLRSGGKRPGRRRERRSHSPVVGLRPDDVAEPAEPRSGRRARALLARRQQAGRGLRRRNGLDVVQTMNDLHLRLSPEAERSTAEGSS